MRRFSLVCGLLCWNLAAIAWSAEPATLDDLRSEDTRLSATLSPLHPARMALRQQIEELSQPTAFAAPSDAILAQQFGVFGPAGAFASPAAQTAAVDQPPELLGVIQDTIAPDSWDVRGGRGVIHYWRPGHALVVRQTGNSHQALADLIGALH